MSILKINLLPKEILLQRQRGSKITLINKLSIGLLVILIVLTSATLVISFFQGLDLKRVNQNLATAQDLVSSQGIKEAEATLVKQQLDSIQSISGSDSLRKSLFNLVVALAPADVKISDATIDKTSNMSMTLSSGSLSSMDEFFLSLASPEKNSGLISQVTLGGLSAGKDGIYHFDLRITAKKAGS